MKTKKILIMVFIMVLMLCTSKVQALQSISKGSAKTDTATNWIINIRNMEKSGGGMGLAQTTINATTLIDTNSSGKGNNIDVHMQKNTEYGAIVLLGASNFGKQGTTNNTNATTSKRMNVGGVATTGTEKNLATSTGNVYGVYELGYYNMSTSNNDWEWTAGGGTSFLSNITSKRYIDRYASATAKTGDATYETKQWHESSLAYFATGSGGFKRGGNGVFSYSDGASNSYYCRPSVVCGSGL